MTEQLMLSAFSAKTIAMDQSNEGFRPWNNKALVWNLAYRGYFDEGDGGIHGLMDFFVEVELREAVIKVRSKTSARNKKVERPGYRLTITQSFIIHQGEESAPETFIAYQEDFALHEKRKAVDVFAREIMNIQGWAMIAESRALFIPSGRAVFECPFCGWVTDSWNRDICCDGCGKRFWSKEMWSQMPASLPLAGDGIEQS